MELWCPTLTTHNRPWVMLPESPTGRYLSIDEQFAIHGVPLERVAHLAESRKLAVGNMIPLPMMGCMLAPFIQMLHNRETTAPRGSYAAAKEPAGRKRSVLELLGHSKRGSSSQ
jgi:hypothetical protein